ncbi:uncharacterized protein F21D5.5-like isoform X2 [Wyeomyia smithii]|uniref:uncharacterized protein F21D5.5-like isoform X2 n=1 Tax=Wyeomyia smithii TaxID=174621 RepID=UPI002467FF73|nr:uncharacterized protein F21D5.5-like isoform X2 [Wyeomyia smithii]
MQHFEFILIAFNKFQKMNKVLKECFLKSLTDRHQPIRIESERTFVGRSPETLIQDPCCSRQQVCLKANFKDGYVLVKCLGSNPSVLNGKQLEKHLGYEAYDGDILELLPGNHQYSFDFKFENVVERQTGEEKSKTMEKTNFSKRDCSETDINARNKNSRNKSDTHKRLLSNDETDYQSNSRQNKKRRHEDSPNGNTSKSDIRSRISGQQTIAVKSSLWEEIDGKQLYVFHSKGLMSSEKIAAYDMDGTLIKTKSGNVFPKTIDDWQLAFSEVPGKLKSLLKNGFKIVIFTNQAGISKGKLKIDEFKTKIEALQMKLNIPLQAFISTGKGKYRKPLTGMWDSLCQLFNGGLQVDKGRSFYIGDAAGRLEQKKPVKRKKDHSCADRLMALNVGIPFFTPEVHFQNSKDIEWAKPEFDPKSACGFSDLLSPSGSKLVLSRQEIIIMVGFPGSGKSHFTRAHLEPKGYTLINRDTLGSWQKCVSQLENTIRNKKSAVIDNTNPDAESRKRFIEVAKKRNVTCRCFVMSASYKQSKHNNIFRELTDRSHTSINDMVFNMYKSKYQEPSIEEGFSEIIKILITGCRHGSKDKG